MLRPRLCRGTPSADVLNGTAAAATILGGPDDDVLHGNRGDDVIQGDAGDDVLWAGFGKDTLMGGPGDDRLHTMRRDAEPDSLDCGGGFDRAWVRPSDTTVNCEVVRYLP